MGFMWSWRTVRALVLALAVILLVGASCEKPKVTRVSIEPSELHLLVGKTHPLTVVVDARGGADRTVDWRSLDASIATVTPSGVVEGVSAGVTEVSARSAFDGSKRDAIAVTIVAAPVRRALSVTLLGSGAGVVSSDPTAIECGVLCADDFEDGTSVTLTASAAEGSSFAGWGGACTGSAATCTVSMTEARIVTATFDSVLTAPQRLDVTVLGSGSGTVTSSPAGIDCGPTCSAQFEQGASVTLTASPAFGSDFTGWDGACTGSAATCTVSMTEARSVRVGFAPVQHTLSVTRPNMLAFGTVSSSPAGIDCGARCSAQFAHGTSVTLTATPATGATFAGWTGACTGSAATCTVSMTQARDVTATFPLVAVQVHPLSVTRAGDGAGTVTSSPEGIDCGGTCSRMFEQGTSVTLTAREALGSVFSGWTGACTGSAATCTVSMTQARSVTATFGSLVLVIRPLNDDFANGIRLTGTSGSATGGNRLATKEAGEPPHAYRAGAWNPGGKSVWWRWTAPNTGGVAFNTFGSSFDTTLAVYTGSAVHQLTMVGFNDDADGSLQSRLVFPVIGGVTYHIVVDGFRWQTGEIPDGDIVLNWAYVTSPERPPLNDDFNWSIPLRGSSGTTTGTNLLATKQAGEPTHHPWGNRGGASVWWQWTAPSTGSVTVSTAGSTFDTVLAVYTGSTVDGLTWVASNDDDDGSSHSRVTFNVTGGMTYRIAVDGFYTLSSGVLDAGIIVLSWGP